MPLRAFGLFGPLHNGLVWVPQTAVLMPLRAFGLFGQSTLFMEQC